MMRPQIKHPHLETIANWYKEYEEFGNIFLSAQVDYLFTFDTESVIQNRSEFLFDYLMTFQSSRIVLPIMLYEKDKDLRTINKIKAAIDKQSRILIFKYSILAETLSPDLIDYLENYNITRQKTIGKTFGIGTISQTGTDTMSRTQNVKTTHSTSTGESETPRYEYDNTTSTQGDSNANKLSTTYGKTVTSTPGREDTTEGTTAHGYYNSGTKADMIREIREITNFNIFDEWLKDILPCFCLETYRPEHSPSSEFVL